MPSRHTAERRETHVRGVRLSFLEWGSAQPGKPSIVLLHGLLAAGECYTRLASLLAADTHVVALDLPGNGHSALAPGADISFTGLAALLQHFLADQSLEQPILLGHSHGGALTLTLAAHAPTIASRLILLCPAHPFSGHEARLVRFYLSRPGRLFAHLLPHVPNRLYLAAFRRMPGARRAMTLRDLQPYIDSLRKPGTIPHHLRLLESWSADMDALRARLLAHGISTPTLILWGARDPVVPLHTAGPLHQTFTHSTLIELPNAGHLPNEDAPEACAAAIRAFLTPQP